VRLHSDIVIVGESGRESGRAWERCSTIAERGKKPEGEILFCGWHGTCCLSSIVGCGDNDHQLCPKFFLSSIFAGLFAVRIFSKDWAPLDLQAPQLLPKIVLDATDNLLYHRLVYGGPLWISRPASRSMSSIRRRCLVRVYLRPNRSPIVAMRRM
jgi:hypothetical protein